MNITEKYITNTNNYSTKYNSHKYIVIHETDNTSKGANASAHYRNLQNNNCNMVGAHYFVDDNYIYHVVRDEHTIYHTGKKYSNKINRPEVNNSNSIGIEICVNSDGNYSNAVFNAKELVIFLMKKYNIPYTNVVRHYDSAGKQCPSTMLKKPSIWTDFVEQIKTGSPTLGEGGSSSTQIPLLTDIKIDNRIYDKIAEYNKDELDGMKSLKVLMIQYTGTTKDTPVTFFDDMYSNQTKAKYSHYVVGKDSIHKYASIKQRVINPNGTTYTDRAKKTIKPTEGTDCGQYICVIEITPQDDFKKTEENLVKLLASYIKIYKLDKNQIFRRKDIIANDTLDKGLFNSNSSFTNLLNAAEKYAKSEKESDLKTGNTSSSSGTFEEDKRPIKEVNEIPIDTIYKNEEVELTENGAAISEKDLFTNETTITVNDQLLVYEPIYPDFTVPPRGSTFLYNEKVENNNIDKIEKRTVGKIVNNKDPYPVDTKIQELAIPRPLISLSELVKRGYDINQPILTILMDISDRAEKRVRQLENILTTQVRYLHRLSSRININCMYYGGQASGDKYKCIRCLKDDLINDGQIVQLDQCLNCSRYEPVIGQVYDILENNFERSSGPIIDEIQSAYMTKDDYVKLNTLNEMIVEKSSSINDTTKNTTKSDDLKLHDELWKDGQSMDWAETPYDQTVDINIYTYKPTEIKKEKVYADPYDDGYSEVEKLEVTIPDEVFGNGGGLDGAYGGLGSGSDLRKKITDKAIELVNLCKQGKGKYSQPLRHKTINGIYYLDCSAFTYVCYKAAGITIPGTSGPQREACKKSGMFFTDQSQALPGDLICYDGHVAIYLGDGKRAHSSTAKSDPNWKIDSNIKYSGFKGFGRPKELVEADKAASSSASGNLTISDQYMNFEFQQIPSKWYNHSVIKGFGKNCADTKKNMAKYGYEKYILQYSKQYTLSPHLVYAFIVNESTGNPYESGSYKGLMQASQSSSHKGNASLSIQAGCNKINEMIGYTFSKSNPIWGYLAYNCGPEPIKVGTKMNIKQVASYKPGPYLERIAADGVRRWGSSKATEIPLYLCKIIAAYNWSLKNNANWGK